MTDIGVYIHIPFCLKKCGYCDFVSFPYNRKVMATYVDHLVEEIRLTESGPYRIKTLFFGGGTPSLLGLDELARIMAAIKEKYIFADHAEVTLESNPGTWTLENAEGYKALGINRISMGVQSLDEDLLQVLGRQHNVDQVYESMALLRQAGFDNINLDLMFALPGQKIDQLVSTLEKLVALGPEHISAYSLTYEEGTPFYDHIEDQADQELDRTMYHQVQRFLLEAGYDQYEISNFSKPGYACQHNLVYWKRKPYMAFGLNSHACINEMRLANTADLQTYYQMIDKGILPIVERTPLTIEDQAFEDIMLNLRLNEGLDVLAYNKTYACDLLADYKDEIKDLVDQGLLRLNDSHLVLTAKGMDLSNQVFIKFL